MPRARRFSRRIAAAAGLIGAAGLAVVAGRAVASDRQDTAFVELNPQYDISDVYAFPSTLPGRVVLVLGLASPITPAATPTAAFGDESEVLYQLKVDNTGDAREDLVFQFTFTGPPGAQDVHVRGPLLPSMVGPANTIVGTPALEGPVAQSLGSAADLEVFAGPRDDPFFMDLEAFFGIFPDRRPVTGPFSQITQGPLTFRPAGQAVDSLRGDNHLAIVIELPVAALTNNGARPQFGVWGTTSRSRIVSSSAAGNTDPRGRLYDQIDFLGNPFVSQLTIVKANHNAFNRMQPYSFATFRTQTADFIVQIGGRPSAYANTIASVLYPDMLVVDSSKDPFTAGWLTWALGFPVGGGPPGWGGRRLTDDVVDLALRLVFSDWLSPVGASCASGQLPLCTDNVNLNDRPFLGTFPYLAPPSL